MHLWQNELEICLSSSCIADLKIKFSNRRGAFYMHRNTYVYPMIESRRRSKLYTRKYALTPQVIPSFAIHTRSTTLPA